MKSNFLEVIKKRRSYYELENREIIGDNDIIELVKDAVRYTPTAHNSQLTRVLLLFGDDHSAFWDMVMDAIRESVDADTDLSSSQAKIAGLKNGRGTVLFYNDNAVTRQLAQEMPLYKAEFERWGNHANAMLQFSVWNMLEEAGFGATLQHYNPIVDERAAKYFNISSDWELIAQMPFGVAADKLPPKEFIPIEKRVFVRGMNE